MNQRAYTILYTLCLTVVFVAVTSAVAVMLRPRIELNQRLRTRAVRVEVTGLTRGQNLTPEQIDAFYKAHLSEVTDRDTQGMLIFEVDGGEKGYVFRTRGQGYWGPIEGYVGVKADLETLTGIALPEHVETPGLGGEINTPGFKNDFEGLAITRPATAGERIIEFIDPNAEPDKTKGEVNAITGATQTSIRVERFLNEDLRRFLEVMRKKSATSAEAGTDEPSP